MSPNIKTHVVRSKVAFHHLDRLLVVTLILSTEPSEAQRLPYEFEHVRIGSD